MRFVLERMPSTHGTYKKASARVKGVYKTWKNRVFNKGAAWINNYIGLKWHEYLVEETSYGILRRHIVEDFEVLWLGDVFVVFLSRPSLYIHG